MTPPTALRPEPEFHHRAPERTGVLLINLGTPESATPSSVRRYLKEFLSDRRVVELPRLLWWPILHGIVLTVRPKKSAEKYAAIWTPEGSPLKLHTERQTRLLRDLLDERGGDVEVAYAMRYGTPSIGETLDRMHAEGCKRILLLPLYPQYSSSTTATAFDAAFAWASGLRNQPELRTVRSFPDDDGYIAALADSVRRHWAENGQPGPSYRLVMSFHGVPRVSLERGDPYHCECLKTGRLLAEALGLSADRYRISFQSRFGRAEWLTPYTAATLAELGREKIERVDVVCPGFPADCLETLEEIALEGKATFLNAGGREYRFIPGLNESERWIQALADLATRHLAGWPTERPDDATRATLEARARRAAALGAPR